MCCTNFLSISHCSYFHTIEAARGLGLGTPQTLLPRIAFIYEMNVISMKIFQSLGSDVSERSGWSKLETLEDADGAQVIKL